jgi:hypothetical protein
MKDWERFRTFKQRGEWVELLFMADAASHGYHVLKPCGDSLEYDVAVEHNGDMIRVQVKSSANRNGTGYLCYFRRSYQAKEPYSIDELDLFAAYIIPEEAWYLIPAAVILNRPRKGVPIYLCPMTALKKDRYRYEQYREAWHLMSKTPRELSRYKRWEPKRTQPKLIPRQKRRPIKRLSTKRRHPERSRISGGAKDLAENGATLRTG